MPEKFIPFGATEPVSFDAFCTDRGIDSKVIERLGYKYLTPDEVGALLGHPCRSDGIALPYFDQYGGPLLDGKDHYVRVRLLQERGAGKYRQRKGTHVHARLTPNSNWSWPDVAVKVELPVIFTEGEFKADLANRTEGWPAVIGLGGVDCWGGNGSGGLLVGEIDDWAWAGREVVIAFDHDSDAGGLPYKPGVWNAIERFGAALLEKGAKVRLVHLGQTEQGRAATERKGKLGLDDFILAGGTWEALSATATEWEPTDGRTLLKRRFALYKPNGYVLDLADGWVYPPTTWKATIAAPYTYVGADGKLRKAADAWMADPAKITVQRFDHLPSEPYGLVAGSEVFNVWPGWGHEPIFDESGAGDVALWLKFVNGLLGEEKATLFHDWCAWAFQEPASRNYTSWFVIAPDGGIGKSLLMETVARAAGKVGRIFGPDALSGEFNRRLVEGSLMVAINELGEGKVDFKKFKHLRTADRLMVNEKYQPQRELPNYMNLMVSSNEMATHRTTADERRDIVVRPLPECSGPEWKKWVKGAAVMLARPEASRAILGWYLQREITPGWTRTDPAPSTEEKTAMTEATRSAAEAIAYEIIEACGERGCIPNRIIDAIAHRERQDGRIVRKHIKHIARWNESRLVSIGGVKERCIVWSRTGPIDEKKVTSWVEFAKESTNKAAEAVGMVITS